ncbi:peptidoglycan-binding domain-containing protein [Leptolyngbya sp. NIES-2104]|uniref:peptidoglycan-binding domain-containing protein n=1 Tax=Leptolyngbya sp. NIES-2104 TaxID=1552121 RepID=UPI0006ECAC45|nr:peptidoglycan-binding protein [Leptolyngbya sp. NIES-2104]GAP95676.1 N-acetylmuramoyl-L-alanine amidase [Leptolyngbya sp. NIES-2104]
MDTIATLHLATPAPDDRSRIRRRSIQLLSAMVGCAIVGFASSAYAQLVLREGDSGTAVTELQERLRALGCFDGSATGFFGSQTRDAVIQCQQQRGITADGVVGADTYRAFGLGNPTTGTGSAQFGEPLQLGDRGPGVQQLQTQLQAQGYYYGTIDGVFGPDTRTAVLQLQSDRGLPQTGVVDDAVYTALAGGAVPPTTLPGVVGLQFGDQGPRVSELQRQLNRLGYPVPVTGYFGTQTQQALASFQQAQGLPPTGVADRQTLAALGVAGGSGENGQTPQNTRRYVVVIPFRNTVELNRIQDVIPNAVPRQSRLGDFVNAGSYTTPEVAERRAGLLRSRGLGNARVVFE